MKLLQELKKMPLTLDNLVGKYVIHEYDDDELITDYNVEIDALSINELGLSSTKSLNRLLKAEMIAYVSNGTKLSIKIL